MCREELLEDKIVSWKLLYFSIFIGRWAKDLRSLVETFSRLLSKRQFTCPEEAFEALLWKGIVFSLDVLDNQLKSFFLLAKFFWRGCQTCAISVPNTILWNILLWKNFIISTFSETLSKKKLAFGQETSGMVVKNAFYVARVTFWGKFNWK